MEKINNNLSNESADTANTGKYLSFDGFFVRKRPFVQNCPRTARKTIPLSNDFEDKKRQSLRYNITLMTVVLYTPNTPENCLDKTQKGFKFIIKGAGQ